MNDKPMKVAMYCRVSTETQVLEPQVSELKGYAEMKRWEVVAMHQDVMSGAKRTGRDGLDAVMRMVREREVGAVLVVKIDRLARSMTHLAQLIGEFDKYDVALVATSQGIDTSRDNPAGRLQMHVLGAVAEFERSLISERTKAGLAVVKASGKQLGHPSKVLPDPERCRQIVEDWHRRTGGVGLRELRGLLGNPSLSTAAALGRKYVPVA